MPCLQFIIIISENKEGREAVKEGKLSLWKEIDNCVFATWLTLLILLHMGIFSSITNLKVIRKDGIKFVMRCTVALIMIS